MGGKGKRHHLADAYRFNGFRPQVSNGRGVFGEPKARILPLQRRSKKHLVGNVALYKADGMTGRPG
jgi:hypothetical protein